MTTTQEAEAREREARERDIARFDAEMAGRESSPFDGTPPLDDYRDADWREVPKGWYALPVCDWLIFGDMVGTEEDQDPEPIAPLMGYLLVARKVARQSRNGRTSGRDSFAPVRLVAAEHAVAAIGFADLTPFQRLHAEVEGGYHEADHPDCDLPPVEKRDGEYYQKPGFCQWHYGRLDERRWSFPRSPKGAERWRTWVAVAVLEDIKEHGVSRYQALYGQLTGKCGRCGRLLTDPESRSLGIGPDCRGVAVTGIQADNIAAGVTSPSPNLDDGVTAAAIARWMLGKLERDGRLYQRAVVQEIADRFGSEFVFLSHSGHLAIDGHVKRSFKRLTPEAVWEAGARCWRWRRPDDAPGRNQGEFS